MSTLLPSPLPNVPSEKWTAFVRVMLTAPIASVGPSNELGAFALMPRRLVDLGVLKKLKRTKSKSSQRTIWAAATTEDHERATSFLMSLSLQMRIFIQSMKDYYSSLEKDGLKLPPNMTTSGALSILHKAGPSGLKGERFPATQKLFEKANGIF